MTQRPNCWNKSTWSLRRLWISLRTSLSKQLLKTQWSQVVKKIRTKVCSRCGHSLRQWRSLRLDSKIRRLTWRVRRICSWRWVSSMGVGKMKMRTNRKEEGTEGIRHKAYSVNRFPRRLGIIRARLKSIIRWKGIWVRIRDSSCRRGSHQESHHRLRKIWK